MRIIEIVMKIANIAESFTNMYFTPISSKILLNTIKGYEVNQLVLIRKFHNKIDINALPALTLSKSANLLKVGNPCDNQYGPRFESPELLICIGVHLFTPNTLSLNN